MHEMESLETLNVCWPTATKQCNKKYTAVLEGGTGAGLRVFVCVWGMWG